MEDSRDTTEKAEIEPASSKDSEKNSEDASSPAKFLPSAAENMERNRSANIIEASSSISSIPNEDLLKICRPISVTLTRLPEAVVTMCRTVSKYITPKKHRQYTWKSGYVNTNKRKKYLQRRKLRAMQEKALLLKSLEIGDVKDDEKGTNNVEIPKPYEILDGDVSDSFETIATNGEATNGEATSGNSDLMTDSTAVDENEMEKGEELTEIWETTAEEQIPLESTETEEIDTTENQGKQDQINFPKISDKTEIHLATKFYQDSTNAPADVTEVSSKVSSVVSPEQNNNQNRKICLRSLLERGNSVTIEAAEARKRVLQSEDDEVEESPKPLSKKLKSLRSVQQPEEKVPMEGEGSDAPIESPALIANQVTPSDSSRCELRFVRRRTRPTKRSFLREVRVFLLRLEESQDPLALKWKEKKTQECLNDVTITACITSPMKNYLGLDDATQVGTVVEGVPITSLEDPSEMVDASKRLNIPQEDPLTETLPSAQPAEEIEGSMFYGETNNVQEDEDDEEIVQFLRRQKRTRPTIDSSSSTGSSSCQEIVSTRILRSKTPAVEALRQESESDSQQTRRTPQSRVRLRSASSDSSSSEGFHNRKQTPKTPSRRREETRRTPTLRKRVTRDSTTSVNSDSSFSREEIRRPPSTRRKAFRGAMEELSLESETSDSTLTHDSYYSRDQVPRVEDNEEVVTDARGQENGSQVDETPDFAMCDRNQGDDASLEALAEVNCDISGIDAERRSSHRNEVLMARRKLTALKNAMVVLTRLEDLDGFSEESKYPGDDIEFKTADDFEFSRSFTPDPLEINGDDNQNPLRETENPVVSSLSGAAQRFSPRKRQSTNAMRTMAINEDNESDVEITLGMEQPSSQETVESDVEMTLILEENSNQESQESDAESVVLENANGTLLSASNREESPDIVLVDAGKDANSQINDVARSPVIKSVRSLRSRLLPDTNSNTSDSRTDTDLENEEIVESQSRYDKSPTKVRAATQCSTCQIVFKDAELLARHRSSSNLCNLEFLCSDCQTTFATRAELTKHQSTCVDKGLEKQSTLDESTNDEEAVDSDTSPKANAEESPSKSGQKKKSQRPLSRRMRSKNRPPVENLTCGVCSVNFATTQALSEHIFKHNTEELQEAYRIAKAKAVEDRKSSSSAASKKQKHKPEDNPINKSLENEAEPVEANKDTTLPQDSTAREVVPVIETRAAVANDSLPAKSAMVCSCHRDKQPARPDKTDLQIEMVLLCQYCQVIFRRRECFEIHYRASPQCANDRARGRWPKLYCANCQSTLNSWAGMRRHLEVHASLNVEGTVRFVCNICRVVFVGFGALFYNHWSSHLKDPMFVASRYSFPKNSVQPIDGIPKLPIGAASNESYILVAEHVCSSCKKPFSTRRDLEMHEKSKVCVTQEQKEKDPEPQWNCDVCSMMFTSRKGLNLHSKSRHSQRYLCVATSPTFQAFMCTRCFAMKKTAKEIEDHWRSQPQHDMPLSFVESMATIEKSIALERQIENTSKSKNENQLPQKSSPDTCSPRKKSSRKSNEKAKSTDNTPVIDIAEDNEPEIDCVFQSPAKNPEKRGQLVSTIEKSGSTASSSSPTAKTSDLSMLRALLKTPTQPKIKSDTEQRPKVRALEDPCVNIVLSGVSKANVSAKLVIDEKQSTASNGCDDRSNMNSYNIVMTNESTSKSMNLVLGRSGATKSTEENPTKAFEAATEVEDVATLAATNPPAATIVPVIEPSQTSTIIDPPLETPTILNAQEKTSDSPGEKKCSELSKLLEVKQTLDLSAAASSKVQPAVPEVIDIADENEGVVVQGADVESRRPKASTGSASKPKRVSAKSNKSTSGSNKSSGSKSKKAATAGNSRSKGKATNGDSGTSSKLESFGFVLDTAEMSFEELRFEDFMRSKKLAIEDSAAAKKPGFLRVKNLSELQAVKTHTCQTCSAGFESLASMEEHYQAHGCNLQTGKELRCTTGMAAALVLPDQTKNMPTEPLPTVYATGNVVTTQQLIGLDSGLGVISGVPVSSVIVNNEAAGSWIGVASQHDPLSSMALVNTTHSLTGGTLLMNLGHQSVNNNNASAIMTTSIAASSATIAQTQEILAVQHQHQQQQQQQQPSTLIGMNQQIGDNCGGQIGFHVMPAMVLPPSGHIDKQQCNDNVLRTTSTANLPIKALPSNSSTSYNSDKPNRYLCNICTTFRCNSVGAMNSHVMKHYHGFHNTTASQNSSQLPARASPNASYLGTTEEASGTLAASRAGKVVDSTANSIRNSWFMRNTPQGVVWVTSLSTVTSQQPGSSAGQDGGQSVGTSLTHQMNTSPASPRGGQIVYRCLICKRAMYKSYPSLRNHVVLVHGITDFVTPGLENIVQKIYLCNHCPQGTVMYDSEEGLRHHLDSCHSNLCPTCGNSFVSTLSLKSHVAFCSGLTRDNQNASHNSC